MNKLPVIDMIALVLIIIGALNWGLVGILDFNLVAKLFGEQTVVSRIIYGLVGFAGVYSIILLTRLRRA